MAEKTYLVSGTALWAKVYPENKDEYQGKTFYSITLEMDEDSAKAVKNTGTRLHIKRGDNGKPYVKFRRNEINEAIPEYGGPPEVVNKDDNIMSDLIGNGSKVVVKFSVYDTKMGKGTRLEKIRVDELVPYEAAEPRNRKAEVIGDIEVPF